jgi:hypothetical protein
MVQAAPPRQRGLSATAFDLGKQHLPRRHHGHGGKTTAADEKACLLDLTWNLPGFPPCSPWPWWRRVEMPFVFLWIA